MGIVKANAFGAKRWMMAVMGTCLQLCLGTVYAWSFFQTPLVKQYGWTNAEAAWAFSLAICFLGIAAACGGILLPKYGPRRLAVSGGALFGIGYMLAALALYLKSLVLLYVGYGVIGGIGLGLGYVTPVATVAKWFPDKKGMVTGMVIMGFGLGALFMSKIFAPLLMDVSHGNLVMVFGVLGLFFSITAAGVGSFLANPPEGFVPPASEVSRSGAPVAPTIAREAETLTVSECLLSWKFMVMWLVFFFNILAGISIISFQSQLMQDLCKAINPSLSAAVLSAYGATLIAASSLFNGIGRLFWGTISDRLGRLSAFRVLIGGQIVVFGLLMVTRNPWVFGCLICYVLLCYGGGFGTMPSLVLDVFGIRRMAVVYGAILTAWSAAGIIGPQIVATLKDHYPQTASMYCFGIGAVGLVVGLLLSLLVDDKPLVKERVEETTEGNPEVAVCELSR